MIKLGDKGTAVKAAQERLLQLRYALPRFGADGHFGRETQEAFRALASDNGVAWQPHTPLNTSMLALLEPDPEPLDCAGMLCDHVGGAAFYDLRSQRVPARPKIRMANARTAVARPVHAITGVMIHQMAVEFGISAQQLRAAAGDPKLALATRALNIACHAAAFEELFVAAAPLRWHVNHGHSLNPSTLGYEIDGRYPGLEDDPTTAPREDLQTLWCPGGRGSCDPTKLTARRIETAREGLRWLVEAGRAEGMDLQWVYAHRQTAASRRSDPGQTIWREVVLNYAVPVLKLQVRPQEFWGDGKPIPKQWDGARGVGAY